MTTYSNTLENINQWIDALESDIYQQTTGRLRRDDAMCCLGVLCHVSNISNWINEKYMGEKGSLPDDVKKWVNLLSPDGKFYLTPAWMLNLPEHIKSKLESIVKYDCRSYTYLTSLNDRDWTFKEIAELIRSNPPGLFATGIVLNEHQT